MIRNLLWKFKVDRRCLEVVNSFIVYMDPLWHFQEQPEPVEKILQTLQVKKEGTFFVGDSEIDKRAARSSGVRFVAYKNREIAEDLLINDHLALLTLVIH